MRPLPARVSGSLVSVALLCALSGRAAASDEAAPAASDSLTRQEIPSDAAVRREGLEPLVPELAGSPYRIEPGPRAFEHRLSVSPGYGFFGRDRLFTLRVAYNPDAWLGYEAAIGHDPGHSAHAVLHTLSAIVRRPLIGRVQPYLNAGYGMIVVFPGQAVNAISVTKNAVALGGGTEFYIRSDLALRADLRHTSVFGKQRDRDGIVVYDYLQGTIGLAFYRSIRP
jgi:opacity protein-like surface antigen